MDNDAFMACLAPWQDKICTATEAMKLITNGQRIFVGTACATPRSLTNALEARIDPPDDIELFHFLTTGMLNPVDGEYRSQYRHRAFFVGVEMRAMVNRGDAEYVPVSLAQVPSLITTGRIRPDVALIQVSPPDAFGYVSLGVSVDIVMVAVQHAKLVIAEVNPRMPRTMTYSWQASPTSSDLAMRRAMASAASLSITRSASTFCIRGCSARRLPKAKR